MRFDLRPGIASLPSVIKELWANAHSSTHMCTQCDGAYPSWLLARRRLKIVNVASPKTIPASTDSNGNPGIPPPLTLDVVVEITVLVVEVNELIVEATEVVIRLVDVVTVETTVVVAVPVNRPPKGEKRSIADSSPPGIPVGIVWNILAEPTAQPLLGEVMYIELRMGGVTMPPEAVGRFCPSRAGEVVTWLQAIPSQWNSVATSFPGSPPVQQSFGPEQ